MLSTIVRTSAIVAVAAALTSFSGHAADDVGIATILTPQPAPADNDIETGDIPSDAGPRRIVPRTSAEGNARQRNDVLTFGRDYGVVIRRPGTSGQSVVRLNGMFGVALDYSQGEPRIDGLLLNQKSALDLRAEGRVNTGQPGLTGGVSLRFDF